MKRPNVCSLLLSALVIMGGVGVARADTIVALRGTPGAGIANGNQLSIGQWNTAVGASALVPFNGFDNTAGPSFSTSFTFNYVIPAGHTIVSANFTLGIYDHDSAAAGDQVALFTLDSQNLTTNLNSAFNASGGSSVFVANPLQLTSEYNVYSLPLTSLSDLADGSLTATLQLKNGFAYPLGVATATANNGAAIDFARLTIETQAAGGVPVPEPASLTLVLMGLGVVAGCGGLRKHISHRRVEKPGKEN